MLTIGNAAPFEYYMKEGQGYWVGLGARTLGLPGAVSVEDWNAIRQGNDPSTGEYLRPIKNVDRVYERIRRSDGEHFTKVYRAWDMKDLCISAPKSVSIQSVVDPRIRQAHKRAVDDLIWQLEHVAGPMVAARVEHERNREGQPQLHTHLIVANLKHDEGGRWGRLNVSQFYRNQQELTEYYRTALLTRIESLGYEIERPEIVGISEETREKFSLRSKVRDAFIAEHKEMNDGKEPTKKEIEIRLKQRRPVKEELSQEEIRQSQYDSLSGKERAALFALKETAENNTERETNRPDHPWMAWSGGVEKLDPVHLASAQRSYERWSHKGEHSLADYVQYTQQRWAEDPGMLERWMANRQSVERETEGAGLRLEDRPIGEAPTQRHRWTYGDENPGPRMRL